MESNYKDISFVHISDLHIGFKFKNASFSFEKGQERRYELVASLFRVIEFVKQNKIDFLLLSGDIFESKYIKTGELLNINYKFSEITQCKVVMISGNHDPLSCEKIYKKIAWADNVYIIRNDFETLVFEDKKCTISGNAFYFEEKSALDISKLVSPREGYKNILMLHGNVFNDDGYCYLNKEEIKSLGYDYIALGHIHKPQFLYENMAYAGSLEPLDFGESGEHGFVLGKIGESSSFSFKAFCKRRFIKLVIEINEQDVISSVIKKIKEASEDYLEDFLRIIFTGYRNVHLHLNKEVIQRYFETYYFEVIDKTRLAVDLERIVDENEDGFIGEFARSFDEKELSDDIYREAYKLGISMLYEEQDENGR